MATDYFPRGTIEADGRVLAVRAYKLLFALFGNTYGGDGRTAFALPDLRGRSPVSAGVGPGLTPHSVGEKLGAETVTQSMVAASTATAGAPSARVASSERVATLPPSLVVQACIASEGEFPARE